MSTTTRRLGRATLAQVPPDARPAVIPGEVRPGIVHLGLGAFHRAHQAVYTEEALAKAGGDWGIVAVAPRSRDILDRLAAQDNLYSVVTTSAAGSRPRVVGSLAQLRHAASDPASVVGSIADPAIRVVTLTVTEKAYQLDPTGTLRLDDALHAQLTGAADPTTVPSLLTRGLLARAAADAGPIAVVCCDNLAANGRRLRGLIEQALQVAACGPEAKLATRVLDSIGSQLTFPSTMVDRIVPATTPALVATAAAGLGLLDEVPVVAEPFRQWVIEDDFPAGRPAWDSVGAIMATDVAPWEALKLRVLNAVHSTLAYLGALAGCETIADAVELPGIRAVLARFVEQDIIPTLSAPEGASPAEYAETVFERFSNPTIGHRTLQIAMDGSQKLPYRLLGTLADRRQAGALPRWGALALAAWMRFVRGVADDGRELPLADPLAGPIRAAVAAAGDTPAELAAALFGLDAIFAESLAGDSELRTVVVEWLTALERFGAADTVRSAA